MWFLVSNRHDVVIALKQLCTLQGKGTLFKHLNEINVLYFSLFKLSSQNINNVNIK